MTHRVLIADDEPLIRSMLRTRLEQIGYDVAEAADGQEAIRQLQENAFDLVIADIIMPGQDGLEVIMFLNKQQPHVKVIAMSAPGNEFYLKSAAGLGAARTFSKPLELAELTDAVEKLLVGP